MADPVGIATNVKMNGSFGAAAKPAPVTSFTVKPEIIPKIIASLETLKGRTDDSNIVQKGSTYSFVDTRTGMPLAELDAQAGTLAMYMSPKDMASRINSAFISENTIHKFINDSRLPTATAQNDIKVSQGNTAPPLMITAAAKQ